MVSDDYIRKIHETLSLAWEKGRESFSDCARLLADTIAVKQNIYVFGCSHAGILAEELFYRSGGLALINPIFFPGFMLNTRPVTLTSDLERVDGIGTALLKQHNVKKGDVLIIHSVSGRNNVPVEMAIEATKMGVRTVCLTNVSYSKSVDSRHSSGKRLFECCELVLDNGGDIGDAAVQPKGLPERMAPTSTAVGTALLNAIIVETVELLLSRDILPPIFVSANLDGGDEWNKNILQEYKENIFYM